MPKLTLRPYAPSDGGCIAGWLGDERTFRLWSANRYECYPITGDDITAHYAALEAGDAGRYFPFTAVDANGAPAGHLLMRYPGDDRTTLRFGFVIVDNTHRRRGLGRAMLTAALALAFGEMGAQRVTLGVFAQNGAALACYRSLGFAETGEREVCRIMEEDWTCIELALERPAPVIVPVTEENLADAAKVRSLAWQDSHRAICSPEFVSAHTPTQQTEFLRREMAAGKRHWLRTDGRPVGVVTVADNRIEGPYVRPDAQRKGHGNALLRLAMAQCSGTPTLWVLDSNSGAEALYTRHGFVRTGRTKPLSHGMFEVEMQQCSLDLQAYWQAVLTQDAAALAAFFADGAYINWHNTNEHFTAAEFITVNCAYPGDWTGKIERFYSAGSTVISVTHVQSRGGASSFHVTSFFTVRDGLITAIDEYWGDDGPAPDWRRAMELGCPIREAQP